MNPFELLFWFVVMSWLPVFVLGCYCRNWVALFSGGIVGVFMVGHIVFQLLTGGAMSKDFSWLFYLLWASVIGLALMSLLLFVLHRDRARYNRRERMAGAEVPGSTLWRTDEREEAPVVSQIRTRTP